MAGRPFLFVTFKETYKNGSFYGRASRLFFFFIKSHLPPQVVSSFHFHILNAVL